MEYDIKYLLTTLSNILGMPARIYEKKKKTFFYSFLRLEKDPFELVEDQVLDKEEGINHYITEDGFHYAYLNHEGLSLILGPTRIMKATSQTLKFLSIQMDIKVEEIEPFLKAMNLIPLVDDQILMEHLKLIYSLLTKRKINLTYSTIAYTKKEEKEVQRHDSYQIEQDTLAIVRNGDVKGYDRFIQNVPYFATGKLSEEELRQRKNLTIVTLTLFSRAAIEEGMDVDDSLSLSDFYIQKCETMKTEKEISQNLYEAGREYTKKIHEIKNKNPLAYKIENYVLHHLDENIKLEDIENELKIPKTTLLRNFRKENQMTINHFITKIKIKKSKQLIKEGYSFSHISYYLGYSSQSHFASTFKKTEGITPSEYQKSIPGKIH